MNFFSNILKAVCILLVSAGIVVFGLHLGPREQTAEAKVFETLLAFTKAMPQYRYDDKNASEPRKVIFNGNTTYLRVGRTRDRVSSVLDFFSTQYPPTPFLEPDKEAVQDIMQGDYPADIKDGVEAAIEFLTLATPHFRVQRKENWGVFGAFEMRDRNMALGSEEYVNALGDVLESGKLGQLGTGRVAIAFKDPKADETVVLNIWTDQDFDLNKLVPDKFGDVGGSDVKDVERCPGARRLLSVSQGNPGATDGVAMYESEGTLASSVFFIREKMAAAGWDADEAFEATMNQNPESDIMFFRRNNRECTINISSDGKTGKIFTTVIHRDIKKS